MSTPTSTTTSTSPPAIPSGGRRDPVATVHRLAKALTDRGRFSAGDLAQLRRLDPRRGHTTADATFWRITTRFLEPEGFLRGDDDTELRQWMAILQGLATVDELHRNNGPRLGQALALAGISEARLNRLLQARGEALLAQIRPLPHQLRSQAQSVDWAGVARLVLSDGSPTADKIRQIIASDYYRQTYKAPPSAGADGG